MNSPVHPKKNELTVKLRVRDPVNTEVMTGVVETIPFATTPYAATLMPDCGLIAVITLLFAALKVAVLN